ncbi:hypothetical protein PR202_gb00448 [Eleusine coracana subsp. coracana]|uniref:Uncharacterized protein n=1 Tax=Eleusine coracana subsp. coracana TaxID=191504 RepID=A0AAV5DTC7_ELECO|nr:hypothetical protein PR202_gb00448 [Eleusine coracana subsp. coracana]
MDQSVLCMDESRPSTRLRTMRWNTSRTCLSSGSRPSLMDAHTAASSAAASLTSFSLSPKSGIGAASIASASFCEDFSSEWISLSRPEEWRLSLRFPSSARRSCSVRRGGAQGNAARGGAAGRWCACSALERSGHGTAATSAHAARWSTQPMEYTGAASPVSCARGAARPAPMAWSCRAADHVRDTLHERERKWDADVEDPATAERDGDARARPKDRLRWLARKDATPPLAEAAVSSTRRTERSESAFLARRSWPSWISPGKSSTDAAMSARRSQRRTWSTPSRAALQTSRALTARSWNSATSFSAAAVSAPRRRAWATTTRNSSWHRTNASRSRRIHETERISSPASPAPPSPGSSSARFVATWRWNASRSASSPDGMAVVSLRSESSERPKEEKGEGEEEDPW